MIRIIAADVGARVEWVRGSDSVLAKALKDRRLHLLAGGVTADNPWAKTMGVTRPYLTLAKQKHVLLAPPGENGWILRLDRILADHHAETARVGPPAAAR